MTIEVPVIPGEQYSLYITEVDAQGNPVAGKTEFGYTVTQSEDEVFLDEQNLEAYVAIINQERTAAVPTEVLSPTSTPTNTTTPLISEKKTGVKTGDQTSSAFYLLLLLFSVFGIEEITRRHYRKKNK